MYRRVYLEALDLLVQTIQARFDQPGYKMYGCIEVLLLKPCHKEDYSEKLRQVLQVYSTDLSEFNLQTHPSIFSSDMSNCDRVSNIMDIIKYKCLLEQRGSSLVMSLF